MAAKTKSIKVIPTGCPGPVAGSKVWACNGEDCPYGPYQYACCKDEIVRRGYTLMIDNEQTEAVRQDVELMKGSLQAQLQEANRVGAQWQETAHKAEQQVQLTRDEQDYIAELYVQAMAQATSEGQQALEAKQQLEEMSDKWLAQVQLSAEQEEQAIWLQQENVRLADELAYCLQYLSTGEVADEAVVAVADGEGNNSAGDNSSANSSCVPNGRADSGEV